MIEDVRKPENRMNLPKLQDKRAHDWPDNYWLELFQLGESCILKKRRRPPMSQVKNEINTEVLITELIPS